MTRAVLFAVAVLAARASAQPAPDAKATASAEADAGQKLYTAGDFSGAAAHFTRAYELDPQPAYLFDAAQAYRFGKDCANAAKYYRQFLDVAKQARAQNLDKVRRYLADMEACAKEHPAAEAPRPSEPAPGQSSSSADTAGPTPVAAPAASEGAGQTQRRVGFALGAVGVAGLATGVVFTALVKSDELSCTVAMPCDYAKVRQANATGQDHESYAIAGYAIGGGALAAGIVLYMLGRHESREPAVVVTPTRNGAAVTFAF